MITVDSNEYASELERKIDRLYDAIDSDPYFAKLGEEEQMNIERELISELAGKDSWFDRTARKEFIKNPVINLGNIELEPVELSDGDYLEIQKTMSREFRNIDAENFDPRDELIDRVAFSLIGKRYIRPSEEREELFLSDDKIYSAFTDAWVKTDAAYQRSIDRFPAHIRSLFYSDSGVGIDASSEVGKGVEGEGGWVSRHKRFVGGLLALLASGAAVYAYNFFNSPKQKLLRLASENDIPKTTANDFYNSYPDMVSSLLDTDSTSLLPSIELYSQDSAVFDNIYKASMNDPQITVDRNQVAAVMSDTVLELGVKGLALPSVYTIGNLTVADFKLGFPKLGTDVLHNYITATQQSPDLVDFRPVVITDAKGETKVIKSANIARDYFLIGKLIEQRPHLAEEPKMHYWLNTMIQQLAWDMFDSSIGPGFYDGVVYSPADPSMQEIIIDFNDYMEKLPDLLRLEGIEPPIHYNDSDLFRQEISDRTNGTIALRYLAHIPAVTFDKQGFVASDYDYENKEDFVVRGKEAMKLFVRQLPEELDEILSSMKDPTIISYPNFQGTFYDWANRRYVSWLTDRFVHGASYTVGQFLGLTDKDVEDLKNASGRIADGEITSPRGELLLELIKTRYGIDQALEKNWSSWDLIKFVKGYERFSRDWGGEHYDYAYGYLIAFKSIGVPYGVISAKPYIPKTAGGEWGISFPDNIIEHLKKELPDNKIVIGYGNLMSPLFSMMDGGKKDGYTEFIQDGGYGSVPRNISPIYLLTEK